jgi:hypothetical protein
MASAAAPREARYPGVKCIDFEPCLLPPTMLAD